MLFEKLKPDKKNENNYLSQVGEGGENSLLSSSSSWSSPRTHQRPNPVSRPLMGKPEKCSLQGSVSSATEQSVKRVGISGLVYAHLL